MGILVYGTQTTAISALGAACPPLNAVEVEKDAWRWVANPMTPKCFHPVATRNPRRLLKANSIDEQCSCWALSMYASQHQAVSAFSKIQAHFKNAKKTIGTHIAKGKLMATHGRSTPAGSSGHFDLHPYTDVDLVSVFAVVNPLP